MVGDAKGAVRGEPSSVYEVDESGEGDAASHQRRFTVQGLFDEQVGTGRGQKMGACPRERAQDVFTRH